MTDNKGNYYVRTKTDQEGQKTDFVFPAQFDRGMLVWETYFDNLTVTNLLIPNDKGGYSGLTATSLGQAASWSPKVSEGSLPQIQSYLHP